LTGEAGSTCERSRPVWRRADWLRAHALIFSPPRAGDGSEYSNDETTGGNG
jgi:hypothetical protein